jgi:predicted PurR-regulated permease PerM
MSKSVGLPAFAVVLCLIIGAKLMGPIGAIISIPVVAILKIVIDHYFEHMKETKSA